MIQKVNEVYKPLFFNDSRYIIILGGRGAGRSTVASQYANAKLKAPEYFRCAIMRYILGDIRNSIYREITDRAEENGILDELDINESTMTISYGNNSINAVGFRKSSSDQKSKLKSLANYNCVIIEEADEIPEADFMQLDDSLRTVKGDIKIILLLNPPSKNHWIIQRWFDLFPSEADGFYIPKLKPSIKDTTFVYSSYKDNIANIAPQSVKTYEEYKETKPSHYWNMIRGLVPEVLQGKIYKNWEVIDSLPEEARLVRYGLDFGYTNDPTSIVSIYQWNKGFVINEVCYQRGMSNRQIAEVLKELDKCLIVADSAEPKSIDEIAGYGLPIVPSKKGQGSLLQGIQFVQDAKIYLTRQSTNLLEEYENYSWDQDKDGNSINMPKDIYNHGMDAIRYAISSYFIGKPKPKKEVPKKNTGEELLQIIQKQSRIRRNLGVI